MTILSGWWVLCLWPGLAGAMDLDIHGLLDARLVHGDSDRGWLDGGLDKQRFDRDDNGLRLGQAVLEGHFTAGTVDGKLWLNGDEDRREGVGVGEAWVRWRPIPESAWRWQAKAGLYFPELSLENGGQGWTSEYLISSSAINTWVGEELRALGGELTLRYQGALAGSPQDWQVTAGVFSHNDPAGGMLAWRGWTVGDRVTTADETVRYPDLPIFRPGGYWDGQAPAMEAFREIDHRKGYYAGTAWRWLDRFTLTLMRYDNRGDPEAYAAGQWAWDTSFNHAGLAWRQDGYTVLAQAMSGRTIMGYVPFHDLVADFRSWYVLASRQYGPHRFSLRYDRFWVTDRDGKAGDPNGEYGKALAAGWNWTFRRDMDAGLEWLRQDSDREARALVGLPEEQREDLWQGRVRWWF